MKINSLLLMAALGLTMSALTAQSADIQITALPFVITAPGHLCTQFRFHDKR